MMPTNALTPLNGPASTVRTAVAPVRKVAIVNGTPGVLTLMERALDAGHYDVVMIESVAHAYSHIKRVQPNLVIVCVRLGNMDGFDVLSMLNLDADTRHIPVLTFIAEFEGQESDDDEAEDERAMGAASPDAAMN
jgi:CheY-like chemotaxis protein